MTQNVHIYLNQDSGGIAVDKYPTFLSEIFVGGKYFIIKAVN
jgi:hypothetical protein